MRVACEDEPEGQASPRPVRFILRSTFGPCCRTEVDRLVQRKSLDHDVRRTHHARRAPDVINRSNIDPHGSMNNPDSRKNAATPARWAGIDVSGDWIDLAWEQTGSSLVRHRWANDADGHQRAIDELRTDREACKTAPARVVVEASGVYSLDLCLALHQAPGIEVMVVNPRAIKDYRRSHMQRSKTDEVDAAVLCDFARRMPFQAWKPPGPEQRELREIARRIQALTVAHTREQGRRHAATSSASSSAVVVNDIEVHLRHLTRRIDELLRQARKVVRQQEALQRAFDHLTSVRGIATKSAVLLLGELAVLPEDMTVRQWVAYAGLDVRHRRSGTSLHRKPCISKIGNKHIRRALYMPALVAIRSEPAVGAFYQKLRDRGKPALVAIVAVMRKLLHSIYGMLKYDADFDGTKFYQPAPETA